MIGFAFDQTRLTWDGAAIGKYTAVVNYVGERYYSGDFANALDKLPGYTTVDFMAGYAASTSARPQPARL